MAATTFEDSDLSFYLETLAPVQTAIKNWAQQRVAIVGPGVVANDVRISAVAATIGPALAVWAGFSRWVNRVLEAYDSLDVSKLDFVPLDPEVGVDSHFIHLLILRTLSPKLLLPAAYVPSITRQQQLAELLVLTGKEEDEIFLT